MSRLFEALRRSELEGSLRSPVAAGEWTGPADPLRTVESEALDSKLIRSLRPLLPRQSRLLALTDGRSLGAEKFRLLSTRLKRLQEERQVRKVLVTSSVSQEGKSLVAVNLAATLARHTGVKTLLLEGDLRQPALAGLLGLKALPGLHEWWRSEEPVTNFLLRLEGWPLWILPAGSTPSQPVELLQSNRLTDLLSHLAGWFDWIVIDSPPLLPLADANLWAGHADGTLLVVRESKTSKKLLQKALETLDKATLLGVVLNEATGPENRFYQRSAATPAAASKRSRERTETRPTA